MTWRRQSAARLLEYAFRLLSSGAVVLGGAAAFLLNGSIGAPAAVGYSGVGVCIIVVAVMLWKRDLWAERGGLLRRKGLLTLEERAVSREAITAVEITRRPLAALLGSAAVSVYSSELTAEKQDVLSVDKREAQRLAGRLLPNERGSTRRYKASAGSIVIMALSSANFFSGLLLTVPLVSWLAKHVDSALPARLYSALEETGGAVLPELSPVLSAAAVIPLVGWTLHFIITALDYGTFNMVRCGGVFTVRRGVIIRRSLRFPANAVSALETRRTLFTSLLKTSRTDAVIAGFGRCVLLPAERRRETGVETASAFPHGAPGVCIRSAGARYWCRWWLFSALGVLLLMMRFVLSAGEWRGAVLLIGLPAAGALLWRGLVGALAGKNAAVRAYGDCVELTGVRGMTAVTLRVFRGSIAAARVVQSPFQRAAGLCSLYILPRGTRRGLRCSYLPYRKCLALLGRLG